MHTRICRHVFNETHICLLSVHGGVQRLSETLYQSLANKERFNLYVTVVRY
jgi:hypothetical protein